MTSVRFRGLAIRVRRTGWDTGTAMGGDEASPDRAPDGDPRAAVATPTALPADPSPGAPRPPAFAGRFLRWSLFLVPLAYFVVPFGVLVHEVLGHGLATLVCGGSFHGFHVMPWGGGMAFCEAPGFAMQVHLGGVASEAVIALLALFAGRRRPPGTPGRVALLLVACWLLMSSFVGVFVGGVHGCEDSDFSKVAVLIDDPRARPALSLTGAVGFIASAGSIGWLLVEDARSAFSTDLLTARWRRIAAALLFVGLPGSWWWVLPWTIGSGEGISIPGESLSPFLGAALCHATVTLLLLLASGRGAATASTVPPGWRSIVAAWCCSLALLGCTVFWWSEFGWWI